MSVIFALILSELIVRDYRAGFRNVIIQEGGHLIEQHYRGLYQYDPYLGWAPRPGVSVTKWGTAVSTLADGIRSNGNHKVAGGKSRILAAGDSFTFGDEVPDSSAWPAQLEGLTDQPVLNAGVSSYGLDQVILRAEKLIPVYNPDIVIVSLIYDDLGRCDQYVRHGVPKPYFVIEHDSLVVKNQPVPLIKGTRLDWFRNVFGYSHLCHKLMSRFFQEYWWAGTERGDFRYLKNAKVLPDLAARLLQRIHNGYQGRMIVLIYGGMDINETQVQYLENIIQKVRSDSPDLEIIDLLPELLKLKHDDPGRFNDLYVKDSPNHHFSYAGNHYVAKVLADHIQKF